MAQQIKVLATKAENLNSVPWAHMVEDENKHLGTVHTHISCGIQKIKGKYTFFN